MATAATDQDSPKFSIGEARKIVGGSLFKYNALIYWSDFLLCWFVGIYAYTHARTYAAKIYLADFEQNWRLDSVTIPESPGILWLCYIATTLISCVLYYRIAMFIHEIVHMRGKNLRIFRFVWHVLCGIPFLIPSFVYHTHLDHHRSKHYGTDTDGEYLPLGQRHPWQIIAFLLHPLIVPPLVFIRFLFFTPIAWSIPNFRQFVHRHCSSMIIDPFYIRPDEPAAARRRMYVQEFFCFLWLLTLVSVVFFTRDTLPWPFFIQSYTTAVILLTLNALRTLGAHRWSNDEGQMTFEQQLLDSVNYPHNPILGEIWAPVGLRFHALHHLFPAIPYHNLGIAHRKLVANLPADNLYNQTGAKTLTGALKDLWQRAKASTNSQSPAPASQDNS
ncbi:MAG: fatty acid desaturase [Planctomycetaceae bacterium]|nr:fatty acid desaturase [Planctomycetaceae bacterium]